MEYCWQTRTDQKERRETNPDRRWESEVWSPVVNTDTWGAHRREREEEEAGEV